MHHLEHPSYTEKTYDISPTHSNLNNRPELTITDTVTTFRLWSPEAQQAQVNIYETDFDSRPIETLDMQHDIGGTLTATVPRNLCGRFYTFQIKHQGHWLNESPGIWAKAAGVNGHRAAIIDLSETNPQGWDKDKGPNLKSLTDAIIYELHLRDISMHPSSGMHHKGKFLALTETGTRTPSGHPTGIDHLIELGITHVHIMPMYDFDSIDESTPNQAQYNWGYAPVNFNLPEGSYSTDATTPATRIREMKEMIYALHQAGIGVIMDVAYNHTSGCDNSNFSLTAPGYYYRHLQDGSYSNASSCGNETASERAQMRDFIINSIKYWASEYHIDGFRFDLMAIHDIDTMNQAAAALKEINPCCFIYGEGWTASESTLPRQRQALKENVSQMPDIAVSSDDLRDAIKGDFSYAPDRGFATGKPGLEEAAKIGIVASTAHPQVDFSKGNKSRFPYASSPTQIINYVSCHDNLCLTDKLTASMPEYTTDEHLKAAKLAQTIIFTSQGTPFMLAGEEIFRSKKGVHNSYNSPDNINAIDWTHKDGYIDLFHYYRELIRLRKEHPAFRMTSAEEIARNIRFDHITTPNIIAYSIINHANGDRWQEIRIIFNGSDDNYNTKLPQSTWLIIARDGVIDASGISRINGGDITVTPRTAFIAARE